MPQRPDVDVQLEVCWRCHQPNLVPVGVKRGHRVLCWRCGSRMRPWSQSLHNNHLAAAFSAAGIIFYLPAITLPLMSIKRFGFVNDIGLVDGVTALLNHGDAVLGLIILFCSIFLPIFKLGGLLILSTRGLSFGEHRSSVVFHVIEWTGRFSMLDVLLVGILVAAVKVGDLVSVSMGPGLLAFASVVFFSLIASWAFDPDSIWEDPRGRRRRKARLAGRRKA